jgi:hypothetical protein
MKVPLGDRASGLLGITGSPFDHADRSHNPIAPILELIGVTGVGLCGMRQRDFVDTGCGGGPPSSRSTWLGGISESVYQQKGWHLAQGGSLDIAIGRPIQPPTLLWPKPLDLRLERGFDRPVRRLNGDHA